MPTKPPDLSIETGTELGPDLGLGIRPEDNQDQSAPAPAPTPDKTKTEPDKYIPSLDSSKETRNVQDLGPAPAPDGSDNMDSFIISASDQDASKSADKSLEMLMGLPDNLDVGIPPKEMGTGEKVGRTVSELLYKAPVKGVRDAAQETINLVLTLDNELANITKGTPFEFLGRPPGSPPGTPLAKPGDKTTQLPDPGETQTVAGGIEKNIVQFLAGFAATGPMKALGGPVMLNDLARGAATMFAAFDGNEQRLGNLIESLDPDHKGGILTDVMTYLKAEDDDPELLGRLKAALEDAGGGVLIGSVLKGIRAIRTALIVKDATKSDTFAEAAQKVASGDFQNELKAGNQPVDVIDNMLGSTGDKFVVKPNEMPRKVGEKDAGQTFTMFGEVTGKGLSPAQYAGQNVNVNFGRIDTVEDLQKAVKELKDTTAGGKKTVPIQKLQDQLDTAQVPGSKNAYELILSERAKRIKRGQSQPLVAEDQEALKSLWVSSSNKLNEVMKTARASPTPENLFAFRKMLNTFGIINNELMGIRHETNRAVNIWAKSERIPMRRMKDIEETLDRAGGIEDNKKLLDQLSRYVDSSPDAAIGISKMAQASRRYGTVRAIRNFWTLGLLTNWKTHEVNAISNTMMMFVVAAERSGASRLNQALGGVEGGVAPGEASAMLSGMWSSLGEAMQNAGRTFRTGQGGGAFNKVEQPFEHNVFEDADTSLKKFINTSMWYWGGIGRALQASDEFFKTLNMSAEVNALTMRQAYDEMRAGKINPTQMRDRITELRNNTPEDILLRAEDTARYATFTKEPGRATKAFARFINEVPGGRFIIPFINTPSNLFNATIERTPFAPLQKQFRDAMRRGGADAQIAMTKMTMGMSLMSMSMSKAFDGDVTGSGPPFWSKEYAQWKAEGKQPYAVHVGNKWVAYNRFDPMGMVLGLGADMAEKLQAMDQFDGESLDEYQNLLAGATFSLASQMINKSYMQGAANLFDAINNPDVSGNAFTNMFAGSLIPAGVGEAARVIDPVQRQSYDFITKWKSRMPIESQTLEPRLDMWGREQKYGTGVWPIDLINPVNITKENVTPIDHEFDLQGWSIPKDVRGFTEDGAKIDFKGRPDILNFMMKTSRAMKPSEMDTKDPNVKKLLRKYGDYSLHDLYNLIVTANHPLYRKYAKREDGPSGTKVDMLKSIYKDYYKAAKSQAMTQFPELQMEIANQEMKRQDRARSISEERQRNPVPQMPTIRVQTPGGDTP